MRWGKFEKLKVWYDLMETGVCGVDVKSASRAAAHVGCHRACADIWWYSVLAWTVHTTFLAFMGLVFFPRFAASYLLRACILVFNSILWIKPEGWRDLPCITALTHCRRFHRSIKFREVLPRVALQRQPKCHRRNDKKTYRYVFLPCVKNQCRILNVSITRFTTSKGRVQKRLPCLLSVWVQSFAAFIDSLLS